MPEPALLALAEGTLFHGVSAGSQGTSVGEVVFNTAMTGYQEILSDPSYARQIINFTYPHIGNAGINFEDSEANHSYCAGAIMREVPQPPSNWRAENSLSNYFKANHIIAIAGIDTRALTHIIRDQGAQNACLMAGAVDEQKAIAMAKDFPGLAGQDLAKIVSTKEIYHYQQGTWRYTHTKKEILNASEAKFHVVVYDFGVKQTILRMLVDRKCHLTVVPATTLMTDVLQLQPDGILFSNGPGDPAACDYAIDAFQVCLQKAIPSFGICLGFQLLALACGARTIKMKFGHHGANHPVQCEQTKRIYITSQNHSFTIDEATLPQYVQVTHRSLFDASVQGIRHCDKPAIAFQGHPEASPGPHDIGVVFDQFIHLMEEDKRRRL